MADSKPQPTEITRLPELPGLRILWRDGHESVFEGRALRLACACANCVNERSGGKMLKATDFPDRISAEHAPIGEVLDEATARGGALPFGAPRFDSVFPADLDGDGALELHRFSKPPLEAVVEDRATGTNFRLIAVHLKSKGPRGAGSPAERRRRGLENRAKQYAQAVWLRTRIEEHMAAGEEVIVLGDFNDGPGLDKLERVNGRSSVEVVTGDPARSETVLANPFTSQRMSPDGARPATARFQNERSGSHLNALIDFIMATPGLAARWQPHWRIWHPFDDAECFADDNLRRALIDASDHFPVSIDMEIEEGQLDQL